MEDIQKILTDHLEQKLDHSPEQIVYSWPRTSPSIPPPGEAACRLIWVESGPSSFAISGMDGQFVNVNLSTHDLIVAPGNSSSRFTSAGQSFVLGFYADFLRLAIYRYNANTKRSICVSRCDFPCAIPLQGLSLFHMLHVLLLNREKRTIDYCINALISMTLYRLRDPNNLAQPGKARYLWIQIENYMRSHQNENLSRKNIADHFHRNPSYISILCKENTNMSFNEYSRRLKIENAFQLLEKNLSIEEIANICGFNQTNYFIRVFKSIHGITPGQYRKQHLFS